MERSKEEKEFLYHEPVKGDIYRFRILSRSDSEIVIFYPKGDDCCLHIPGKVHVDGSFHSEEHGDFFCETPEWMVKYQESLYLRVCQARVKVYFVNAMKRGKVNTRALVIDDNGSAYHTFVSTFPPPRLGESYMKLRMDLTVVSLTPVKDLYEKVMEARRLNPTLL